MNLLNNWLLIEFSSIFFEIINNYLSALIWIALGPIYGRVALSQCEDKLIDIRLAIDPVVLIEKLGQAESQVFVAALLSFFVSEEFFYKIWSAF